ncbi:TPA: hypothetical protein J1X11_004587, partial [Escherichia coli]|nr:hypothetical protein [Escherichia coli]
MKNARDSAAVVETALCTFVLSRIAGEIASILDRIPLLVLRHSVHAGFRTLFRPEPQTVVGWADANYYLPKESAYQEERWDTLPFQRAIMNAMGSDYIREVNVVKSARVGYSKMLLGVYAYFIEHSLTAPPPGVWLHR